MNVAELAYRTIESNPEFFVDKDISRHHLEIIYKTYYGSIKEELFNPEQDKRFFYFNDFAIFQENPLIFFRFLEEWKIRLRLWDLKQYEDPNLILDDFEINVLPSAWQKVRLWDRYLIDLKTYLEFDNMGRDQKYEFYQRRQFLPYYIKKCKNALFLLEKRLKQRREYFDNLNSKPKETTN